jgi:hypothetical protein
MGTGMTVRVHPKVTTAQLHSLCDRHSLICRHDWTRGRLRVFVEIDPSTLPFQYFCETCDWSGAEPEWDLVEMAQYPFGTVRADVARCPSCRSFNVNSRINT